MTPRLYQGFGLSISSDVALPPLMPVPAGPAPADVRIRYGDVPPGGTLPALPAQPEAPARAGQPMLHGSPGEVLLSIDGVARYLVQNGRRVTVAVVDRASEDAVAMHLLSTVVSILLHQRGVLVLHGSGIAIDGQAVLFLGDSGAGKSTLAAALSEQGYAVVTDDVCAIEPGPSGGSPAVHPGFPYLKLWRAAFAHLARGPESLAPLVAGSDKLISGCPVPSVSLPIAAIYLLRPTDAAELAVSAVTGGERLLAVSAMTLRPRLLDVCASREAHFTAVTRLAAATPVRAVQRPREGCPPHRLAAHLIDDFSWRGGRRATGFEGFAEVVGSRGSGGADG